MTPNTKPESSEELEAKVLKDLSHTLKLVPLSQRELFIFELSRYLTQLITQHTLEARIDEQTNHVMLGGNVDCQGCYNAVMYNSDRLAVLHSTNTSLEEKI